MSDTLTQPAADRPNAIGEDVSLHGFLAGPRADDGYFGDRAHADAAAAHVDRLHEHAVFTDSETGEVATRAKLNAEIEAMGDRDAALILPATDIALALRNPSGGPLQRWVSRNVQYGMLALMPAWALRLYGIDDLDDRRVRTGRRWMGLMMKLAARNRRVEQLIDAAMAEATVHPYRRVRPRPAR